MIVAGETNVIGIWDIVQVILFSFFFFSYLLFENSRSLLLFCSFVQRLN